MDQCDMVASYDLLENEDSIRYVTEDLNLEFSGSSILDMIGDDLPCMDLARPDVAILTAPISKELHGMSEATGKRLRYAIDEIKGTPATMVLETQTPWCHPHLYRDEMPQFIEGTLASNPSITRIILLILETVDTLASCALYLAKTRTNSTIIMRSITSRACALAASPPPLTAVESLAYTQSLLLHLIILLFDGDISARAAAERTLPTLETSAIGLLSYANFDIDIPSVLELPLYPLAPTKAFWKDWIFEESVRRTLLFTFYFVQIYRILAGHKGLQCDGKLGLCHSWTVSAHLWEAGTAVEFAEAWKEKNHLVVTNAEFEDILEKAQAHDVDWFGRILISSWLGIDEAEGWFVSRGGSLRSGP